MPRNCKFPLDQDLSNASKTRKKNLHEYRGFDGFLRTRKQSWHRWLHESCQHNGIYFLHFLDMLRAIFRCVNRPGYPWTSHVRSGSAPYRSYHCFYQFRYKPCLVLLENAGNTQSSEADPALEKLKRIIYISLCI